MNNRHVEKLTAALVAVEDYVRSLETELTNETTEQHEYSTDAIIVHIIKKRAECVIRYLESSGCIQENAELQDL